MKNLRIKIFNFVVMSLTLIALPGWAQDGRDGGGGNLENQKPLDADQIQTLVDAQDIRISANIILVTLAQLGESFEISAPERIRDEVSTFERLMSLKKKMTDYGVSRALDLVNEVLFRRDDDLACFDQKRQRFVDAYADVRRGEVCFNASRIAKRNLIGSVAPGALAVLLAHEVTHFFGSSEKEAEALERFAKKIRFDIDSIRLSYREALIGVETVKTRIGQTLNRLATDEVNEACQAFVLGNGDRDLVDSRLFGLEQHQTYLRPDSSLMPLVDSAFEFYHKAAQSTCEVAVGNGGSTNQAINLLKSSQMALNSVLSELSKLGIKMTCQVSLSEGGFGWQCSG